MEGHLVAVVTGGSGGVGKAVVDGLVKIGVRVFVFDLVAPTVHSSSVVFHKVDVGSLEEVSSAVATIEAAGSEIGFLVNCAGWDRLSSFVESDPNEWTKIIRINLNGVLNTTRAVLPRMMSRKVGCIVNVASDAGRVGSSGEAVYGAAKGGVIAFTKTIAREAVRSGVRCNCVCPGPTDTPLLRQMGSDKWRDALKRAIPMQRFGTPEETADAVLFLLSSKSSYITGQTLSVNGGLAML